MILNNLLNIGANANKNEIVIAGTEVAFDQAPAAQHLVGNRYLGGFALIAMEARPLARTSMSVSFNGFPISLKHAQTFLKPADNQN